MKKCRKIASFRITQFKLVYPGSHRPWSVNAGIPPRGLQKLKESDKAKQRTEEMKREKEK